MTLFLSIFLVLCLDRNVNTSETDTKIVRAGRFRNNKRIEGNTSKEHEHFERDRGL